MAYSPEFLIDFSTPGLRRRAKPALSRLLDRFKRDGDIDRWMKAWEDFDASIHFLAGVLKMLPLIKPSIPALKSEGEGLLVEGHALLTRPRRSISRDREIRDFWKHEDKVDKFIKKIEKTAMNNRSSK